MSPSQISLLPFKLRSSCDACGQAKIKCDRGQPACARCLAQGVGCVYGVSRKAGKPRRRRPAGPEQLPSRPAEPETSGAHDDMDIMLTLGIEGDMAIDSPFSASDAAFQSWFPLDNLGSLGALDPFSQSDSPLTPVESSTTIGQSYCTQKSKEIMRRLYCANPASPISDGVPARTLDLDSVLTRNRDVVGRLGLLLKCPCARSPHTAMLYASIVSRVLLWYQQAAQNAAQDSETVPSSLSSATLKSVLPTPVMVGTFQSDDGNLQTALTNCLILGELKKAGDLIDSFIAIGTGTGTKDLQTTEDACPAAGELSANVADASLFASLGAWLQTEHRRIVRTARSGLSVLDEDKEEN